MPMRRSFIRAFADLTGVAALPELCAVGLRNPFRCGFDRDTDELYCGGG